MSALLSRLKRTLIKAAVILGVSLPYPVHAQPLPACALSGSTTVMIGGKPALRLSDVANCPPDLYEVITSITIEGQPVVQFKSGSAGKTP